MAKSTYPTKITIEEVFNNIKHYIADNNLTLEEVSSLTGVDADFIMMFFENTDNISVNIDRLISFSNTSIFARIIKTKKPTIYRWQNNFSTNKSIKLLRIVKPVCSALYNKNTKELYSFKSQENISNAYKQLIVNEMYDYIDNSNSAKLNNK